LLKLKGFSGLSECLNQELSAFNIRVLVVEPGLFRTQFINSIVTPAAGLTKDYEGTPLEGNLTLFRTAQGKEPGDPDKAAIRIVAVVDGTGEAVGKTNWLRLPLGPDCIKRGLNKADSFRANFEAMKDIALGTNF
jgi:NAD(P)-dependent dehydrogenase (short-subunit alcohol dehydrogenase family)